DTRPNSNALRKCILSGPYKPTTIVVQDVAATDDSPAIPEHTTVETPMNMSPANKAHFEAEKETIRLILTGIGDEIYSTVDAFQIAQEMWEAIERLQQGESLNIQDVKTKLFWEFGKFTSHDGETMESYYIRFYKLMNEMIRNNMTVATMPVKKNLALIAKYFKKIYKPTNNNLRTSSNLRNKNVDMAPRYRNDNQFGQFGNQRTMNVAGARENVGSPVVQQSGIQCFKCKEFGHFAKERRKPKRVKDFAYHKEKMLLCKQAEKGVSLQVEQYDWLADTNKEINKQELEAHYSYMAKIQEVPTANTYTDSEPLEKNKQTEFEKYKAFNDRTIDYDKLERKLNETLGQLAQKDIEIKEGLKLKAYEISMVKEKHDELIKQSLLTKSHYKGLVKQKTKFAPIPGYGDLVQGNITINRVYYVEGLNHNLFAVGQFCDADLDFAFWKSTCFVRDLQGNDLLTGNRGSDLYTISLQESTSSTPLCPRMKHQKC
nr:integrase, catalytic region, zinc finger, CCHC-type, peptidase aspartic, catalytic [Tanacetum cinerariifolium]